MDTMQADVIDVRVDGRPRVRKVYSEAFKRRMVALTFEPGVSVSQVAQRHGINTNLLFSWRKQPGNLPSPTPSAPLPALLSVAVSVSDTDTKQTPLQAEAKQAYIEVEVGTARMRLHGGVDMQTVAAVMRMLERGR
jgi:transposase